jgi:hypothetical protein
VSSALLVVGVVRWPGPRRLFGPSKFLITLGSEINEQDRATQTGLLHTAKQGLFVKRQVEPRPLLPCKQMPREIPGE